MVDFCLSDKIQNCGCGCITKRNIKEFIRLLKEEMGKLIVGETGDMTTYRHSDEIIDKLAGEKLLGTGEKK